MHIPVLIIIHAILMTAKCYAYRVASLSSTKQGYLSFSYSLFHYLRVVH